MSSDGTSLEMSIGLTNKIISSYLLFIKFSQEAIVSCSLIDTIVSQARVARVFFFIYLIWYPIALLTFLIVLKFKCF